jgi:hypothetical protein
MNDPIPQFSPRAEPGTGTVAIGTPVARVDGRAKVTGTARYAAEHTAFDLAHGVVVNSTIAKGKIAAIDCSAALAVPGVIDVFTHARRPRQRSLDLFYKDMVAPAGSPFKPLHDAHIYYSGHAGACRVRGSPARDEPARTPEPRRRAPPLQARLQAAAEAARRCRCGLRPGAVQG